MAPTRRIRTKPLSIFGLILFIFIFTFIIIIINLNQKTVKNDVLKLEESKIENVESNKGSTGNHLSVEVKSNGAEIKTETETKTFDTNTKTFDTNTTPFDTNTKTFDTNTKTFDTNTKTFDTNSNINTSDFEESEDTEEPESGQVDDTNSEIIEYDKDTFEIIEELIKTKRLDDLKKFLEIYPKLVDQETIKDKKYLIHLAVEAGYFELVQELIKLKVDLNRGTDCSVKIKPIHLATQIGSIELLTLLLDSGVEVDSIDSNGETALLYAVICEKHDAARFLLSQNANPNKFIFPSEVAVDAKSVPNSDSLHVKLILNVAISLKDDEMAVILLDNKADPTLTDSLMMNALHAAAFYQRPIIVSELLNRRLVDVNSVCSQCSVPGAPIKTIFTGCTALQLALKSENDEIIQIFEDHNADIKM